MHVITSCRQMPSSVKPLTASTCADMRLQVMGVVGALKGARWFTLFIQTVDGGEDVDYYV